MTGFSLTKKAVGAYFNDGEIISSCQVQKEWQHAPSPHLIESVKAAQSVFFALESEKNYDPKVIAKIRRVVVDVHRDVDKRYPKKKEVK